MVRRLLEATVIVLLCGRLCLEAQESEVIRVYIDGANGTDSTECLSSNSTLKPCQTLPYVAKNLNSTRAEVTVLSERLNLTLPVEFKHFHWLVVSGNVSTILCSETNAGLAFVGLHNLTITSLSIQRCGAERNSTSVDLTNNKTDRVSVAVYILNCTGVDIRDVNITSSNGRGLSMYDTNGSVSIVNCMFSDNFVNESSRGGGGGLYIEFTFCSPGFVSNCYDRKGITDSTYNITNCRFLNNVAYARPGTPTSISPSNPLSVPRFGKGGGLYITIGSDATNNSFFINQCTFQNNSASLWGNGMLAELLNSVANTIISVSGARFIENHCAQDLYCGGLVVGLMFYNKTFIPGRVPSKNAFRCSFCTFEGNRGGGLLIVASKDSNCPCGYGTLEFSSSNWTNNTSPMGAAVFINPGLWDYSNKGCLPTPKFINCTFKNNSALESEPSFVEGVNVRITSLGYGTMAVSEFNILFEGNLLFSCNEGTAVHISNGVLEFGEGSTVNFLNNTAHKGGAIAMYGTSVLQISNNSTFNFVGNKATLIGGAIYVEFIVAFLPEYHNCFLQSQVTGVHQIKCYFLL